MVLARAGAVGGVDVGGGAPGTRETDLLAPTRHGGARPRHLPHGRQRLRPGRRRRRDALAGRARHRALGRHRAPRDRADRAGGGAVRPEARRRGATGPTPRSAYAACEAAGRGSGGRGLRRRRRRAPPPGRSRAASARPAPPSRAGSRSARSWCSTPAAMPSTRPPACPTVSMPPTPVLLARSHPDARVLLTTYSDTLANALHARLSLLVRNEPRMAERIEVHSIGEVGRAPVSRARGEPRVAIARRDRGSCRRRRMRSGRTGSGRTSC